jgi:5-methylcytosine-specific restriction endonuclease McrA
MKRLFGLILAAGILVAPGLAGARPYHFTSGRYHSYRAYRPKAYSASTLRLKSSTHLTGFYKSTGLPKVNRCESARYHYLKNLGYDRVPAGYEVDHIVPLSRGGADEPYNMRLLTESEHHQKTAREQSR